MIGKPSVGVRGSAPLERGCVYWEHLEPGETQPTPATPRKCAKDSHSASSQGRWCESAFITMLAFVIKSQPDLRLVIINR